MRSATKIGAVAIAKRAAQIARMIDDERKAEVRVHRRFRTANGATENVDARRADWDCPQSLAKVQRNFIVSELSARGAHPNGLSHRPVQRKLRGVLGGAAIVCLTARGAYRDRALQPTHRTINDRGVLGGVAIVHALAARTANGLSGRPVQRKLRGILGGAAIV